MKFSKEENNLVTGIRIDKFLAANIPNLSRVQVQSMIKDGSVKVNGKKCRPAHHICETDIIKVKVPDFSLKDILAEDIELEILLDKEDYMVINKPAGMVVHAGDGGKHSTGTVVNAVMSKIKVDEFEDKIRPGIVHRLDKDTSGLLIIAKTGKAYDFFVNAFKEKTIKKNYLTLVRDLLNFKEGVINSPIARDSKNRKTMCIQTGGKEAISNYKVVKEYKVGENYYSLLDVEIKTGRTHQIRVHLKAIGHPVIGDSVYGGRTANTLFKEQYSLTRQFLHAKSLEFIDMYGEKVSIESELPEDLDYVIREIQ